MLQENALKTFDKELPHWLHRIAAKVSEPLTARLSALPAVGAASRVSTLRREFQRVGGQVTFVDDHDPKKSYRKWRELHHEVCHVLGFELPERSSSRVSAWEEASLDLPLCPELWVDEAWPPCKLAPTFRGRVVPVWSAAGNARNGERSLMILQGRIVRSFPARQIKALIGHELGRMAFALLTGPGLKAWAGGLSKVVVGQKLLQGVQSMSGHPGRGLIDLIGGSRHSFFGFDPFGRQSRSYSLGTINLSLFGGRSDRGHAQDGAGVLQGPQLSSGIVRPIMEMLAVDMVVKHAAPRVLRPIIWLGVLARGGPGSMMDSIRQGMNGLALPGLQLSGHRRPAFWAPMVSLMAPFMHILVQLGALRSASAVIASCGRSSVITADRAAALSAGDAEDAAAAILRVYGQMPMESARGDELEALLDEAADSARRQKWTLRREALLQRWSSPAPEERVRELLRWSESSAGQRLLALAELRRASYTSSLGWWHWCCSQSSESPWMSALAWQQLAARVLVVVLVALPFFSRVDLVRWASMCTLGVTMLGLLAPLLLRGAGLSPAAAAVSACSLVLYASFAWIVWWNHLLGGSRRWAQLSSRLTSQLADQADVTAGIAYLTRDWAEMARRSHAALDQEFCGSWRTSLHELASKLTDIWSDIRNASLCSGLDGASPRVKSARSVPRAALDHDAGYLYQDRGQQAVTRAGSAPLGGQAMMALQLWLKVDRAVQRALHVEAERMRKALDTDDTKTLQAMMNWWSANNSSVASAAAAAISTGTSLLDDGWEEQQETLGALLLSERLHQRFQYRSFAKGDEMPGSEEPGVGVEEFERLEQALAANFESLQDLRRRLAPLASPAGTLRCPCRSDLLQGAAEVQSMLRRSLSSASSHVVMMRRTEEGKQSAEVLEDSPEDRRAELRILMTLALAACCGVAAVPYAAIARAWLWAIAFFGFALANIVLLLNYQRLSLPHVHRRFERQLSHLSSRREEILVEIRDLQRSSQKAGAAHARACIFLQSVNVLRNINYVVLCIKTETQRAAAAAMGGMGGMQESVVLGGLRLLLALLPRCEQRWEAEILADDDCRVAVAALADAETEPSARLVAESQKRLWILLRMVHLSSVLPIEAQGQLGSLVQRYARPILIEGRVPLQNASALEMHKADHKEETLLKAAGNGNEKMRMIASKGLPLSARRALPASEEMPDWMSQSFGAVPSSAPTESVIKDLLKQLRATRKDCIRILQRLPPEALLSRIGEDTTAVLRDLLSSVIVTVLPGSGPLTPRNNGWSLGRPRSSSGRVAVALGYRHGETVYVVENLRLNLLLRVATIRGEIQDARSGSINELRQRANSGPSRAEEIEVPLTAVLEEAPGEEEAEALWLSLAAAYPGFYGNNALQERKSALRRVSAAARQMRRG